MKKAKQKRLDFLLQVSVEKQRMEGLVINRKVTLGWLSYYTDICVFMGKTIQRLRNEKEGWERKK